jgi:hypothetical protein
MEDPTQYTQSLSAAASAAPGTPDEKIRHLCDELRTQLLGIEQFARQLKDHSATKQPDTFPGQRGEMIAQSMLAVRHIEDARMRLGKVLQYSRDGVSINDKT